MANVQIGVDLPLDFVDKRATQGQSTSALTNPADFATLSSANTRLLALGLTQTQLNSMTVNDTVYALRVFEESAGIN